MADFPADQTVCVPEGRHSVVVRTGRIERAATVAPAAAVRSAVEGGAFGAVSVYLERVSGPPGGAVPSLTWELRARHSGLSQSEAIPGASGTLTGWTAWSGEGSIVHVSGHFALGYELWLAASGSGAPLVCSVRWVLAPPACGPYSVESGTLA